MPGICGIVGRRAAVSDLARSLEAMQDGMIHEAWHVRRGEVGPEADHALGCVSLGYEKRPKIYRDEASGSTIILDGELYEAHAAASRLGHVGVSVDAHDHARILLAGYQQHGSKFFRDLHGSFSAAIWNGKQKKLILVTDRFGTRPLYYEQASDEFRFASSIASLLAADQAPRQVNPRGLAQFFTFGHYLRADTSLQGVHLAPAAACFEFSTDAGRLTPKNYWSLQEAQIQVPADKAELFARIDEAFTRAVHRCSADSPQLGISLSGGLDARAILGVMDTRETPLSAVCLGVRGSLDHRSSAELARLAHSPFHAHILDGAFLSRFGEHLQRMVRLTDGQYLSQCIVIPTLSVYRDLGIQSLLRGHAGELMHMRKAYSYSLDEQALDIRTDGHLRDWLLRHLQAYMLDGVTEPLFTTIYQEGLESLAVESFDEDLAEASHIDRPLDRIWHLFVHQRLRRETTLSMVKFRSVVEPRLPYLDNDLIPLLLSAPAELKLGEEIQTYILGRRRPDFLRVINANTGAPMGAPAWRQRWSSLQLKVLAKLGVPGYQPYERLGLWLRRELAPFVRDILLSPRTLERGVYRPEGIRAVVRQHLDQGRNHTFLLMALMIFELATRSLVDEKGCLSHEHSVLTPSLACSA
jgi:asparagine synthase (glutamine-hydrolysing)